MELPATLSLANRINTFIIEQKNNECKFLKEIQIKQLQNVAKGLIRIASELADPSITEARLEEQKKKQKERKERRRQIKLQKKRERYRQKCGKEYIIKEDR